MADDNYSSLDGLEPKEAMIREAQMSANGELVKVPNRVLRDVPTGKTHRVFGTSTHQSRHGYTSYINTSRGNYYGGYGGYGNTGGYGGTTIDESVSGRSYDREVIETKKQFVTEGEKGVKIVYPSPASASHSQVLEQFFAQNLRTEALENRGNAIPLLQLEVEKAKGSASARDSRAAVVDMLSKYEAEYIKKIGEGQDKDKVALDIIGRLYESKEGNPVLEGGQINAGHYLLLARGNGSPRRYGDKEKDKTQFDGSAAQLFNYYMAVQRNMDKRVGGSSQTYADYFAKADTTGYTPSGKAIAPDKVRSPKEIETALIQQVSQGLEADIAATKDGQRFFNGDLNQYTIQTALEALKEDVKDGRIHNPERRPRNLDATMQDITLSNVIKSLKDLPPTGVSAAQQQSITAVVDVYSKKGETPLDETLANDLQVVGDLLANGKGNAQPPMPVRKRQR